MRNCLYFLPVNKQYISEWEYYVVDADILDDIFDEVITTNNYFGALLKIFSVDVIYCWWWHRSLPIILLCKLLRKKVYVTGAIHMFDQKTSLDFYGRKSVFFRIACRIGLALSDGNFFISKDQYQAITSHLVVNNPYLVYSSMSKSINIENNFNSHKFNDSNEYLKLKIGFLGWLQDDQLIRKGLYTIIDALDQLNAIENKYELIIAGKSGDSLLKLKNIASKSSFTIDVRPNLSFADKENFYKEIDIFVNPSSYEGFGNATLEALTYGLPVIVTRFGASWEVVGDSGEVLMDIDVNQIQNAIVRIENNLINNKQKLINDIKKQLSKFEYGKRLKTIRDIICKN